MTDQTTCPNCNWVGTETWGVRCPECEICLQCGRTPTQEEGSSCRWTDCPSNIEAEIHNAAVILGRRGGCKTTEAQVITRRANGRKGGRPPRKVDD